MDSSSVGFLGKGLNPLGPVPRAQAQEVFREEIRAMVDTGADLTEIREDSDPRSRLSAWSHYNLVTRTLEGLQVQAQLDIHQ